LTCDHLGIPSPKEEEITAENVSVAFKDGRIKEIKEYCLRDVQATYNAYLISKNYTFIK
jgi:predicted PolB exonuclease-like 3'-5' exonuclease